MAEWFNALVLKTKGGISSLFRESESHIFFLKIMNRKEYIRNYQRKWMAKRRAEWLKNNGPCVQCNSWENLEVDHINPKTKIITEIKRKMIF